MRFILVVCTLLVSSFALAKESMNAKNKSDSYKIMSNGLVIGTVTVATKYTGEPMMEGTTIRAEIKCSAGYKLNPKYNKPNEFAAYDYGANGKLSEFNAKKNQLTIFHRSASVNDDGKPEIDESMEMVIDISQACLKK